MSWTLALLAATALPAQRATLDNLDFSLGKFTHWHGEGFTLDQVVVSGHRQVVASSADGKGKKALLHRTFVLPENAHRIAFRAAAVRPAQVAAGPTLDVVLEAAKREFLPRQVRTERGWALAPALLPPEKGQLREYAWDVSGHAGRRVRIALVDGDDRPGCHVLCGPFRLVSNDEGHIALFAEHMRKLEKTHKLRRFSRSDSKHFVALSNAPGGYTDYRLYNCETIYADFFNHFRKRGFAVRPPAAKMMVAIFDTQKGFQAYVGTAMPSVVTGLYHTPSNRLVVYDFGTNRDYLAEKKRGDNVVRKGTTDLERQRLTVHLGRYFNDRRDDTNISTIMHEVAHQLSFNGGLLNRTGDAPAWLVEGLAVYCESTVKGAWQGIGEPNPQRAAVLEGPAGGRGSFLPLRALVQSDDWLRKARSTQQVVLGYSQSWGLFHWLIRERPAELRKYMALIHDRRAPDHRLADFASVFGGDLGKLEKRYFAYLRTLARR
jgi:hypothetical protein